MIGKLLLFQRIGKNRQAERRREEKEGGNNKGGKRNIMSERVVAGV